VYEYILQLETEKMAETKDKISVWHHAIQILPAKIPPDGLFG
jgi:hypothetical protein